jgi:hypothetical protein
MSTNEPAPGGANANDSVAGGGGGKAVLGGPGEQSQSGRALFVGFIYPSPLDKDGQLPEDQSLREGFGKPQMAVVVYGYNKDMEGASQGLHAAVDEQLGQPFFKAYIYPIRASDEDEDGEDAPPPLISVAGGGGGKAVLGGASTIQPIYLGQLFASAPSVGAAQGSDSGAGGNDHADE